MQARNSSRAKAPSGPPALMAQVLDYINENLDRLPLTPRSIAAAHGISVRHLHRLFTATGTTVSLMVRKNRLARCAADFRDPALCAVRITLIAFRWGFNDSAHFSKAFRAEFGECPRVYRARYGAPRSSPDRRTPRTLECTSDTVAG